MDVTIRHNELESRFELITATGQLAGYLSYEDSLSVDNAVSRMRDFQHTVVLPEFRGQGLSRPLIAQALADAKQDGLAIKASCSAVAHYLAQQEGK